MEGLITEGSGMMHREAAPEEKDAGLIAAAQRVEHYEIASYGTVATYTELLSDEQPQELLQATLDEEKRAAQKLTELPKAINVDAAETIGDEPEDTSLIRKGQGKGHRPLVTRLRYMQSSSKVWLGSCSRAAIWSRFHS
jgi:Domain of unknown function (DUF892)